MYGNLATDFGFVSSCIYEENGVSGSGLAAEIPHPAWNCPGRELPAQYEPSSSASWPEDSEYLIG